MSHGPRQMTNGANAGPGPSLKGTLIHGKCSINDEARNTSTSHTQTMSLICFHKVQGSPLYQYPLL